MGRFKKLLVALAAVLALAGQVASDGVISTDEIGQLVVAALGTFGVYAVPNVGYGVGNWAKLITALVSAAGVVAAAYGSSGGLAPDEIGQLVAAVVALFGVAAVRNSPEPAART